MHISKLFFTAAALAETILAGPVAERQDAKLRISKGASDSPGAASLRSALTRDSHA